MDGRNERSTLRGIDTAWMRKIPALVLPGKNERSTLRGIDTFGL